MQPTTTTRKRCTTTFKAQAIDSDQAWALFYHLQESADWQEGIRGRNGFTRLQASLSLEQEPQVAHALQTVLQQLLPGETEALITGVYLNYYKDGTHYTPNHRHEKTRQLVLSLGATRTLVVGKKEHPMSNGDAVLFGGSIHGVPKEEHVTESRISIAVFLD